MGAGLFQPGHLVVILIIALIIFGPGKLPELGSALGQGIREFKRSVEHLGNDSSTAQASATLPAAPAGTTAAALTCGQCHTAVAPSARFCTSCGHQLPSS